jgi:hypothetical protein
MAGRFGAVYRPQDSNKSGGMTQCHTPNSSHRVQVVFSPTAPMIMAFKP